MHRYVILYKLCILYQCLSLCMLILPLIIQYNLYYIPNEFLYTLFDLPKFSTNQGKVNSKIKIKDNVHFMYIYNIYSVSNIVGS